MKNLFSSQIGRILSLSSLGFTIIFGYTMARAAIDSLFLETYSSEMLPTVWLCTSVVAAVVIAIYNQFSARKPLMRLMVISALLSALMLSSLLLANMVGFGHTAFLLYIWKDVYIVLLVEIYWSFSDVIFSIQSARKGYGLLLALSTTGGILGNLAVGPIAKTMGTFNGIWIAVPLLVLVSILAFAFAKASGDHVPEHNKKNKAHWKDSINVIKNSRYLVPMMLLVALVQIVITLIDYQYSSSLQLNFPDIDMRTDINGKVHAAIDGVAILLQVLTGPILRLTGVAGSLILIPACIGIALVSFLKVPVFNMMMTLKVTSKSFDYSLFRAAKEILYIPLSHAEKTQGKAVIDIFIYRTSKGLSSIILLGMIAIGLADYTIELTLFLEFAWLFLTYVLVKRYRSLVPWEEEIAMRAKKK